MMALHLPKQLGDCLSRTLIAVLSLFCVSYALAQGYPVKPVRIVTSESGRLNDFTARLIAQALTGALGKHVIVETHGAIAIDIGASVLFACSWRSSVCAYACVLDDLAHLDHVCLDQRRELGR
jgi:hypothetical protein